MRQAIIITIIMIFFPVHISYMGKDALTTGTIGILLLYAVYLIQMIRQRRLVNDSIDTATYMLIAVGIASTLLAIKTGTIDSDLNGHAVRQLTSFATGLLLFMVIKNYTLIHTKENAYDLADKLIKVILLLIAAHVIITIMILNIPQLESVFRIFYAKEAQSAIRDYEDVNRYRSFVFSPEQYGEILAALSPFVVYRLVTDKKVIWYLVLLLFAVGLMLSVTRSGILLFIIGSIVSFYCFSRQNRGLALLSILISAVLISITIALNPSLLENIMKRFILAGEAYSSRSTIFEIVNRDTMPEFWQEVVSNISLIGHSLVRIDFHNLFLTTVHQVGIIGAALFFLILLSPLMGLMRRRSSLNSSQTYFKFACLLFMVLFLVNELKFEFTRITSYQQICWALIGVVYLVSRHRPEGERSLCRQMEGK